MTTPTDVRPPARLRRWLGSAAGTTIGTSLAIQAANALTGIYLARSLGPDHRGELALIVLVGWFVVVISSLGVVEAIAYFGARVDAVPGVVFGSALTLGAAQAAGGVLAGALTLHFVLGGTSSSTRIFGYGFLLFVPTNLAIQYCGAMLRALGDFRGFNVARSTFTFGSAAVIVTAGIIGRLSVPVPLCAYSAAGFAALWVTWVRLRRLGIRFSTTSSTVRSLLLYGVRSFSGSVSSLFNEQADQLLVGLFIGAAQLGLYVVAVTVTSTVVLIGQSTALVALPQLASLADTQRRALARKALSACAGLSAAAAAIGALLAPWGIPMLFGDSYRGSVFCAQLLFGAAAVLSMNRLLAAVIRAENHPGVVGLCEGFALTVTISLLSLLAPLWGITGAAVASICAYGASFCAAALFLLMSPWRASRAPRLRSVEA